MQVQTSNQPTETYDSRPVPWNAVLSMSLCAFVLVASEFMPVSLLTPIARDLAMTEGQAGQVISVSGIFAVVTSLFLSQVVGTMDRRRLILILTGTMVLSGFLVAFAPQDWTMMLGRALLGISIGGIWGMSAAVMIRVVPAHFIPKALALLQGGSALATAVAAPIGSFLGGLIGWRGAFFCIVPVAALVLIWQALSLPSLPGVERRGAGGVFGLLRRTDVAIGMAGVGLLFMGQFALFTYLRPFLETVTQVDVAMLSANLLVIGFSGLLGTALVGRVIDRSLLPVLVSIPLVMAAVAVSLMLFGSSTAIVLVLLGTWGLIATPAPVGWFTWMSRTLPEDTEAGGGLMVAVIQLAITLGATFGGMLYDADGYVATFSASAVILVLSGLLAMACSRTGNSTSGA